MGIARSRLFRIVRIGGQQGQEWELPLASESNCNRIKM
jgi:hypothetical protein